MLIVQTAPGISASAAFAGLLFGVVCLFFDATCVAFFLTASGGRAAVIGQRRPGDESGNSQAGKELLQVFFVHKVLLC